jgi:hypothetical protein
MGAAFPLLIKQAVRALATKRATLSARGTDDDVLKVYFLKL